MILLFTLFEQVYIELQAPLVGGLYLREVQDHKVEMRDSFTYFFVIVP